MCLREFAYRIFASVLDPDWWMVALTVVSIGASTALAFLAFRNGERAVQISEQASKREQDYRQREEDRRVSEERGRLAYALMKALTEFELTLGERHWDPNSPTQAQGLVRAAEAETEALTLANLHEATTGEFGIHAWFERTIREFKRMRDRGGPSVRPSLVMEVSNARVAVGLWNTRTIDAHSLQMGTWIPKPRNSKEPGATE